MKLYTIFVLFSVVVCLLIVKFIANSLILDWLIYSLLSASLVLPLLGLGIGFSSLKFLSILVGIILYIAGFFVGFIYYADVGFYFVVDSSKHLYFSMPIASLSIGLLLVLPDILRKGLILLVSPIVGIMIAITTNLTDPTLHNLIIPKISLFVTVWIILFAIFSVKVFYCNWFHIPIKIFGSWLIASGLLYGGVGIATKNGTILPQKTKTKVKKEQILDTNLVPDFD